MAAANAVQECIEICVNNPDCHGVVTAGLACYFRGGKSETPDLLVAQKTPDTGAHLYIIFGTHHEPPSPPSPQSPPPQPPPPPPPDPPLKTTAASRPNPYEGAVGPTFLLFLLALVGIAVYAVWEVPWLQASCSTHLNLSME